MASFNPLNLISSIDFMSNHAPQFSLQVGAPSDPNTSAAVISFLKSEQPALRFNFVGGIDPVTVAPYGQPGPSKWPAVKIGALAFGGISSFFFATGLLHLIIPRKR